MNQCSVTLSVTAVAEALAKNLSDEELDVIAAVFTQLGDTLATIAALREACK